MTPFRICLKDAFEEVIFEKEYPAETYLPDAISDAVARARMAGHEPQGVILKTDKTAREVC